MKAFPAFFLICVFLKLTSKLTSGADSSKNGVYIVYMGAATSPDSLKTDDHAQLLTNSALKNGVLRKYKHGFSGFAARLSKKDASIIANIPGVVSVFPDPIFQLHTTRSWDFLKYQTDVEIDTKKHSPTPSSSQSDGSDTIIGVLDTGIWPESESFSDKDMGPIPKRWKGTCMKSNDFKSSNCNRKVIGVRFYKDPNDDDGEYNTPRDIIGHGSHVASTAAGSIIQNASYYGLATGVAKGGSPAARLSIYRVCTPYGCPGSSILAAFDDAIADGVDILSLSLGASSSSNVQLSTDPIALGSFHAVEKGITVICSAGNDGPTEASVVNTAPWILTVGASTIDRDFESDVVFGQNKLVLKGGAINFANIGKTPVHPFIHPKSIKNAHVTKSEAANCNFDSLVKENVKGKIVICDDDGGATSSSGKMDEVQYYKGIGLVVIDDQTRSVASNYGTFPMSVITTKDAAQIFAYLNSTKKPVGTILSTVTVPNYKPAPTIAYFSARGPSSLTRNILKPDIAAPGVNILAAWTGNDTNNIPEGKKPTLFNIVSGTSMATPHVTATAALVKSRYPAWSPSAIRSAIMTTATQTNNLKGLITTETGSVATPYDYGAGQLSTTGPLQPGLVFETSTADYLNFLCYFGYNVSTIKLISKTMPSGFSCPKDSSSGLISNINYPSISVSGFNQTKEIKKSVSRTVTNVGGDGETLYTASVGKLPAGINVRVTPEKLQFSKAGQKLTYQVVFTSALSLKKDVFGHITWSNGKYKVRTPFVLNRK